MQKIIKGKTHCDNIGDFFRNPVLLKFIKEWYRIKNTENTKPLKIYKHKKDKIFSFEFYAYIKELFEDRTNMCEFLGYIRESLLTNQKFKEGLERQYESADFVALLLALDDLNDQLFYTAKVSLETIFSTKIIQILRSASITNIHDDEEYSKLDILEALGMSIYKGIMPINERGELLGYIDESVVEIQGKDRTIYHMSTISGGASRLIKTDKNGNELNRNNELIQIKTEEILDSREDVMKSILVFEEVYEYHKSGCQKDISENGQIMYENLAEEYAIQQNITIEEIFKTQESLTKFKRWMIQEYKKLENLLKSNNLKRNNTKINEWKKQGIKKQYKPHSDLPDYDLGQKIPKKKGIPKLTVVKNQ